MQVSQTIELPDGNVKFEGEFSAEEVGFLIEYALRDLIIQGLIPLDSDKQSNFHPGNGETH